MTKQKDNITKNLILNAAKHVFETKGMAGAKMQEIGDKANVVLSNLFISSTSKDNGLNI